MSLNAMPDIGVPLGRLLVSPPLRAPAALVFALAAVAAPTLMRIATGGPTGDGFCAYLPFVTFAAMALDWRAATVLAAVSGLLADYLFEGVRFELFESAADIAGVVYFAVAAGLIILLAQAFRKSLAHSLWLDVRGRAPKSLVFSRRDGEACVSWYGGKSFVPLGPADEVEMMMRDYLAQQEVGRRLARETAKA